MLNIDADKEHNLLYADDQLPQVDKMGTTPDFVRLSECRNHLDLESKMCWMGTAGEDMFRKNASIICHQSEVAASPVNALDDALYFTSTLKQPLTKRGDQVTMLVSLFDFCCWLLYLMQCYNFRINLIEAVRQQNAGRK